MTSINGCCDNAVVSYAPSRHFAIQPKGKDRGKKRELGGKKEGKRDNWKLLCLHRRNERARPKQMGGAPLKESAPVRAARHESPLI
jgi:hypothetical protein